MNMFKKVDENFTNKMECIKKRDLSGNAEN